MCLIIIYLILLMNAGYQYVVLQFDTDYHAMDLTPFRGLTAGNNYRNKPDPLSSSSPPLWKSIA